MWTRWCERTSCRPRRPVSQASPGSQMQSQQRLRERLHIEVWHTHPATGCGDEFVGAASVLEADYRQPPVRCLEDDQRGTGLPATSVRRRPSPHTSREHRMLWARACSAPAGPTRAGRVRRPGTRRRRRRRPPTRNAACAPPAARTGNAPPAGTRHCLCASPGCRKRRPRTRRPGAAVRRAASRAWPASPRRWRHGPVRSLERRRCDGRRCRMQPPTCRVPPPRPRRSDPPYGSGLALLRRAGSTAACTAARARATATGANGRAAHGPSVRLPPCWRTPDRSRAKVRTTPHNRRPAHLATTASRAAAAPAGVGPDRARSSCVRPTRSGAAAGHFRAPGRANPNRPAGAASA